MQDVQGVGEDGNGWGNGAGSPRGGGGRTPPPRRSRSRSPGRGRGPPPSNNNDGSTNPGNNLHVSGLSSRVDNRQLEELFAKYGRVQKAAVMYDPHTRESRGFGFVTMETGEEADAAVSALSGTEFMGKPLSLEKARRGRARTPTPGRYFGPPKRGDRPYEPRGYDSRGGPPPERRGGGYGGGPDRGGYGGRDDDRRRGGGYDDRRDYDRGGRYDDRRPYDDRRGGGDYERGGRYDDRRYDDRRYDDRRYDDRRPAPPPGAR